MINFLQAAADAAPEVPAIQQYSSFIFIGLMILAMWLLIWRPESKKRKEMAKFLDGLKKGDKIVTAGGIYGVIKEVKDASVLIEVDSNVTLRVSKSMVTADPASVQATK
ncbi:MAG: preprotein translocase subunit YajC [Rikenellaceae bacterium]